MRFEAKPERSRLAGVAPVAASVATLFIAVAYSADAFADLTFTPSLGIEQIFTDNVTASGTDRNADGITVLSARIDARLTSARINAAADVNGYYNEFWATNSLDNFNANGTIAGRGEILTNLLFVDAIAQKQQVYLSPTDVSASGLTTGQGNIEQQSYGVSPFIETDILGIADLLVRGTYAQVQFDKPVVGLASTLLTDLTVKDLAARITTGERSSLYELTGTAEHLETDLDFQQDYVIGGVVLKVTKTLAAVGHVGYEHISDPSISDIKGTIWSVGGRYTMGNSSAQFEYGHRFDGPTYIGSMALEISPSFNVTGNYTDTLTPIQLTLVKSVSDLLDQDGNFVLGPPSSPSFPNPLILDSIVRDKNLTVSGSYTVDLRTYTLAIGHFDRFYPTLVDNERNLVVGLAVGERLSRRLSYLADVQFQDNYEVLATRNTSESYRAELSFIYQYNDELAFKGGYAYRLQTGQNSNDVYENILRFGVVEVF